MIEAIRERVTVTDVLRAAGITVPQGGRMACPLHAGHNRSTLSMYDGGRRWTCWAGCGHGDAIDMAAAVHGLSPRAAVQHCAALAGIAPGHVSRVQVAESIARRRRERAERRARYDAWRERWDTAIERADTARDDVAAWAAAVRLDPEELNPQTRAVLDALGDVHSAEELALLEVAELERAWRAEREAA